MVGKDGKNLPPLGQRAPAGPVSWASGLRRRALRAGVDAARTPPGLQACLWPSLGAHVAGVSGVCFLVCLGSEPKPYGQG